ncbi:MAG: YbaB/EbfC family nucleoid-associated protein [Alphaproteobacteria bacterium]|nr:YbaB/EbfC family nucleoid-associated protein [Alphaproteobacteria bacterium]
MLNIQGLMKQAQVMQEKMREAQERLGGQEREGTSGGGLVKVTLNGKNEVKKISISPELMNKDETDVLEDLLVAAFNDAHQKIEIMQEEGMKEATGGMNFGGLKIPF